jgi:hypothetical protein
LTDEQRTLVLGRLYNQMKLAPHRPSPEKEDKLSSFSGHNATSRYVASFEIQQHIDTVCIPPYWHAFVSEYPEWLRYAFPDTPIQWLR